MAERELTDAEVFGPQAGELSDAEVFGPQPTEPPPDAFIDRIRGRRSHHRVGTGSSPGPDR